MAYQDVGTPRFYINVIEWLDVMGALPPGSLSLSRAKFHRTLPVIPAYYLCNANLCDGIETYSAFTSQSFVAFLGHSGDQYAVFSDDEEVELTPIINGGNSTTEYQTPAHAGFSICSFDGKGLSKYFVWGAYHVGSVVLGTYYDMPHSPDIQITMTRNMDGVSTKRSAGGSDITTRKYLSSPPWGDFGPWELGNVAPNPAYTRSGRRSWDIRWSNISHDDLFPMINSHKPFECKSSSGNTWSSSDTWHEGNTILDSNSFYSQVIHKTNGRLPFIFNPNGGGSNPNHNGDQFAICVFEGDAFRFNQVANGSYSLNLKITEVW